MANRHIRSSASAPKPTTDYLCIGDEDVVQALVTAGALVALADGELEKVEGDELVSFIDRQGFAPTISPADIAETFDNRVRELEGRYCADVIVDTLTPLTGQSLASVVVRTAQRVAAADGKIHPGELQALKLIRRLLMSLPAGKPAINMSSIAPLQHSMECGSCETVLISPAWSESTLPSNAVAICRCPICGNEFGTTGNCVEKKLSDELVRAFFPSLLVA